MIDVTPASAGIYAVRLSGTLTNLILTAAIERLKARGWLRALAALAGLLAMAIGAFGYVTRYDYLFSRVAAPFLALGFGLVALAVLSSPNIEVSVGEPRAIEEKTKERKEAEEAFGHSKDPFDALELASKRLNEYYTINQSQARGSFRWAVFAMFCGFITIVAGVWIFYLRATEPDVFLTSLATAAGFVTNVVSALYLYLHNKTQRRALYYYGQLVRTQQTGVAIRLAESHEEPEKKAAARDRIIDELLGMIKVTAQQDTHGALTDAK